MIATLIKRIRRAFFRRKLAADVAKRKAAFETQDYVKRRKAALKREPRVWAS